MALQLAKTLTKSYDHVTSEPFSDNSSVELDYSDNKCLTSAQIMSIEYTANKNQACPTGYGGFHPATIDLIEDVCKTMKNDFYAITPNKFKDLVTVQHMDEDRIPKPGIYIFSNGTGKPLSYAEMVDRGVVDAYFKFDGRQYEKEKTYDVDFDREYKSEDTAKESKQNLRESLLAKMMQNIDMSDKDDDKDKDDEFGF